MRVNVSRRGRGVRDYQSLIIPLGGINTGLSSELIANDELADVRNFVPDTQNQGVLIKREGIAQESSAQTEAITSIFQGFNANYFSTTQSIRSLSGSLLQAITASTDPSWAS